MALERKVNALLHLVPNIAIVCECVFPPTDHVPVMVDIDVLTSRSVR
jgi:hypothetical protein